MITGVIGSGAMGAGIAQVFATAGHKVFLLDKSNEALTKAATNIKISLDKLVAKGTWKAENVTATFSNIHFTSAIADFANCELVIEAILEDLAVKQQLFKELETVVTEKCVLASNTSSLSITSIAAACKGPERCIGIHFFNPAPVMQLVEIIPAIQTKQGLVESIKTMMQGLGKLPVIAKDTPGFIVNRVARPFYGEAIRILEEGFADCATIDWAMTSLGGFKMGPFTLMDFIGHDVNYRVTESVFTSFFYDPRYKPSFTQKRLFEAGYYGRKSGRGFFNYSVSETIPLPSQDKVLGMSIMERIVAMLINEAADVVSLNVATVEDVETAMTKGVNYPKGLLAWADEWGVEKVVDILDSLYHEYHEDRYRVSALLRKMKRENKKFLSN